MMNVKYNPRFNMPFGSVGLELNINYLIAFLGVALKRIEIIVIFKNYI